MIEESLLLNEEEVQSLLAPVGFTDLRAAQVVFNHLMAGNNKSAAVRDFLPHLLAALANAADPDRVIASLERFVARFGDGLSILNFLAGNPRAVEILVVLFAGSQFLTEILLRNPELFERLLAYRRLARPKSVEQLYTEAQLALAGSQDDQAGLDALRRYQSGELLRIGACDLLDLYDLPAVTRQLSNLADALIRSCLKLASTQAGGSPEQICVLGMGKLGGRELNYSSDIDLLFITQSDPVMAQRIGEKLIDALARATAEGFLYRVDMRLRPWGRVGPLVSTVPGFATYLARDAQTWEKQALLKARFIAGDASAGRTFLDQAQPVIFGLSFDELQSSVRGMKQRTEAQLRQNGRFWGEVKLGEGSIRDVEFTAQFLQLAYGAAQPEILSPTTLDALVRLAAVEMIQLDEHRVLSEGYIFLRTIEHYLQMMHYRQTHSLPEDAAALETLAQRLGFAGENPGRKFVERYEQHIAAIRAVYMRYVGGPVNKPAPLGSASGGDGSNDQMQVHRHLDRMAPSYSEVYSAEEISRHAAMAARLTDDNPAEVDFANQPDGRWRVTVVAYDFPGELSVITGLMFVYGLNILSGEAFTYVPAGEGAARQHAQDTRRKIVDVFNVQLLDETQSAQEIWAQFASDLAAYQHMVRSGHLREMQGDLTRRVATSLQEREQKTGKAYVPALYPIDIEVDNEASDLHTMLRISAPDTVGFLYELTNALSISRVYIDRVVIDTVGSRVQDTLFVNDANGRKITDEKKQRELRAATVLIKHYTHLLPFSPNPEIGADPLPRFYRPVVPPPELA